MNFIWGCSHTWTTWKEVDRNEILKASNKAPIGVMVYQERYCTKCGIIKGRYEETVLSRRG